LLSDGGKLMVWFVIGVIFIFGPIVKMIRRYGLHENFIERWLFSASLIEILRTRLQIVFGFLVLLYGLFSMLATNWR
jgi:hypothetical protein